MLERKLIVFSSLENMLIVLSKDKVSKK